MPFNSLMLNLECVLDDEGVRANPAQHEHAISMKASAESMMRILNDVLSLQKIHEVRAPFRAFLAPPSLSLPSPRDSLFLRRVGA